MRTCRISIIRWAVTICAAVGALVGCDDAVVVCTLIGCTDPLTVQLSAAPAGAFQVALLVDGVIQDEVSCPSTTTCGPAVFFRTAPTDRVSIRVITTTGTRVTEFPKITYTHRRVNGRDCPPDCLNATITAQVPA